MEAAEGRRRARKARPGGARGGLPSHAQPRRRAARSCASSLRSFLGTYIREPPLRPLCAEPPRAQRGLTRRSPGPSRRPRLGGRTGTWRRRRPPGAGPNEPRTQEGRGEVGTTRVGSRLRALLGTCHAPPDTRRCRLDLSLPPRPAKALGVSAGSAAWVTRPGRRLASRLLPPPPAAAGLRTLRPAQEAAAQLRELSFGAAGLLQRATFARAEGDGMHHRSRVSPSPGTKLTRGRGWCRLDRIGGASARPRAGQASRH